MKQTSAVQHKRPKFCNSFTALVIFSNFCNAFRWDLPLLAWVGCCQPTPLNIPNTNYQHTQRNIPRRAQVLNHSGSLESRKVNSSGTHKIPHVLWNVEIHFRVHNSSPPDPKRSQMNPVHAHQTHFKIHLLFSHLHHLTNLYFSSPLFCPTHVTLHDLITPTLDCFFTYYYNPVWCVKTNSSLENVPSETEIPFTLLHHYFNKDCRCNITACWKVKQSHYRPGQVLRVEAPIFWDNRHMKVVRCQSYAPAAFHPHEIFLILISVRGWVDPTATARPEELW